MSKITRNNYEEFFIDYFDGSLNNHEVAELMLFLAQNRDLDDEFNQFKFVELKQETINFDLKDSLKKQDSTITGSIFYDKCIDKVENNLSDEDTILFEAEINSDKSKKVEYNSFKSTILKPDLNIIYTEKENLKKEKVTAFQLKRVYQYAAILVALIISYTLLHNNTEYNNVAESTNNYASMVNFDALSSFDKYDNQQAFTIVKTETPSIVAKSSSVTQPIIKVNKPIYINKLDARKIVIDEDIADNIAPIISNRVENIYIVNNIINENTINETSVNKQEDLNDCNPNCIKALTNEIKSDVYISEMMSQYKNSDNIAFNNNDDTKTVWEFLGESISVITGSKMEKSYDKNGKVSRLALNGNRFRVSKKIRK